jgi:predicted DNA-binding transcriptional regulator YafY
MSYTPETLLRHWQTLRLLPRFPHKTTAKQIQDALTADGYAVTKRTIERDLSALSKVFPLVADDREKPFGWSWGKDAAAFDLPGMSNSEALTLLMGREHIQSVLPSSTVAQMLPHFRMAEKTLSVLKGRTGVAAWPGKVRVVPPTQPLLAPRIAPKVQATLHEALLNGRQCLVKYQGRSSAKPETYTLHPLALVQRGQVLYLVCTIKTYSDIRLLVLHRIRNAELLDAPAARPKSFDLDAYLASGAFGWTPGELIRLDAAFTQEAGAHLVETPLASDQHIKTMPDGRMRVQATVRETQQLVWWLLGFGEGVEVLAPRALRRRMAEKARALTRLYVEEAPVQKL